MAFEITLLIICLALSGFFSGAETALVSVSIARAKSLVKEKRIGSRKLLKLKEDPKTLLSTILIGNNVANIGAAALATAVMIDIFGNKGIGIATGVLTVVILIFGEITPKNIAHVHNVRIGLMIAPLIYLLSKILLPVIWVLNHITGVVLSLVGGEKMPIVTEEELKSMIDMSVEEGGVEKGEREIIERVFQLNDLTAEDIMTPRTAMFCLSQDATIKKSLKVLAKSPYSRVPIIRGNRDNVVGILYVKDVLKHLEKSNIDIPVSQLAKEPHFIPEKILLNQLFKQLQDKKIHMAVIVDEHGGVAGLVTMEDILEELVGEIDDETDEVSNSLKMVDKHIAIVTGDTEVKEINEFFNMKMHSRDSNTISKVILDKVKHIPKVGEEFKIDKFVIRVESATKRKINRVKITKIRK